MIPHLRAALIAGVLCVAALDAAPIPPVTKQNFADPALQTVFEQWAALLRRAGVEVAAEDIRASAWTIGGEARATQRRLLAPAAPLQRLLGTGQAWGLFAYPDTQPQGLVIEGRSPGEDWVQLYAAPGPGALPDLSAQLHQRRMRGAWQKAATYKKVSAWWRRLGRILAARVIAERPELDEVRLSFERRRLSAPGELAPGAPTERRLQIRFTREQIDAG